MDAISSTSSLQSINFEQFMQMLNEKLHEPNAPEKEVTSGHEFRLTTIQKITSKLESKFEYTKDDRFLDLLSQFAESISKATTIKMRMDHFADFVRELRLYVKRHNNHLEKTKISASDRHKLNTRTSLLKTEVQVLGKKLEKVEGIALSLDDMDKESYYTRMHYSASNKMHKLIDQLHEMQNLKSVENTYGFKPFHFKSDPIEQVNRAITEGMNQLYFQNYVVKKNKKVTKMLLPDFADIVEWIGQVNAKESLGLNNLEEYAKRVFKEISLELRSRRYKRWLDMITTYEMRYANESSYGATQSPTGQSAAAPEATDAELEQRLRLNDAQKKSIQEYLNEFQTASASQAQAELIEEQAHVDSSSADSESDSEVESIDSLDTQPSDTELCLAPNGIS